MCEPISISAAIAASLKTAQGLVQNEMARDYNKDLKDATEAEMLNAKVDAQNQQAALSQQQIEQAQALAQEKQALARELLAEQATARVGSAEGGIGGVSKIRSFVTSELQAGSELAIINQNENNVLARTAQRNQAILDQFQGRVDASQASFENNAQGVSGFGDFVTDAAISGATSAVTAGLGQAIAGAFSAGGSASGFTSSLAGDVAGGSSGIGSVSPFQPTSVFNPKISASVIPKALI